MSRAGPAVVARAADKAPAISTTSSQAIFLSRSPAAPTSAQPEKKSLANDPRFSAILTAPIQRSSALPVSSPNDPAEKEAEAIAKRIMSMPDASPAPARAEGHFARAWAPIGLARSRGVLPSIARKSDGRTPAPPGVAAAISGSASSGAPLPEGVRRFMEPRFGADFSAVRVHTGPQAAGLNRTLSARAFATGHQIFFGPDQFRPETPEGRELIAHELTHTIQQGATVQRSPEVTVSQQFSLPPGASVQRSPQVTVSQKSPPQVQRLGMDDVLDFIAEQANLIPGFRMFTIVLGVNPVNMSRVERSAANILRAIVEFLPGGGLITRALDAYGVFDRVGGWIERQLASLGISGASIKQALTDFIRSLGLRDLLRPGNVWERARRLFSEPIDRIIGFIRSLAGAVLQFIKDAILRPLAELASQSPGWDLLCAVLGRNPITGDAVPRTAETLIGGFMKLIGQEEIWENIKRGKAIARAFAWFQGALAGLLGFVQQIPGLFLQALQSLEIADIVLLPRAFVKVGRVFAGFVGKFINWAGSTVWDLLEIIFSVVAPGVMTYLNRARAAFRKILQDPVGFVGNLVKAAKLGFTQFAGNFVAHLRRSLIGWLTGSMSGASIYIPTALSLAEIGKFVLSIAGITWAKIRTKIVRALGPGGETIMATLETTFDIVVALVRGGPAAAWEVIKDKLSNLRDLVLQAIIDFVKERVITAAVTKLISLLSPASALIQAIIATYNTVMFFVERLRQIGQVVASFIDSISAIANGIIAAAANRVEQTLGGLLTLVISFLARLVGLGRVTDFIVGKIKAFQARVDAALDRAVDFIVRQVKRLGRGIARAGTSADPRERLRTGMQAAIRAVKALSGRRVTQAMITPVLAAIRIRYGLKSLTPKLENGVWWVEGEINPKVKESSTVEAEPAAASPSALPQRASYSGAAGGGDLFFRMATAAGRTAYVMATGPITGHAAGASRGRVVHEVAALRQDITDQRVVPPPPALSSAIPVLGTKAGEAESGANRWLQSQARNKPPTAPPEVQTSLTAAAGAATSIAAMRRIGGGEIVEQAVNALSADPGKKGPASTTVFEIVAELRQLIAEDVERARETDASTSRRVQPGAGVVPRPAGTRVGETFAPGATTTRLGTLVKSLDSYPAIQRAIQSAGERFGPELVRVIHGVMQPKRAKKPDRVTFKMVRMSQRTGRTREISKDRSQFLAEVAVLVMVEMTRARSAWAYLVPRLLDANTAAEAAAAFNSTVFPHAKAGFMADYRAFGPAMFDQAAAELFRRIKPAFERQYGFESGQQVFLDPRDITAAVNAVKTRLSELYERALE